MTLQLSIAAVLLALPGCSLVDLEVRAEQVCVTVADVEFDGVPALPGQFAPASVERAIDLDEVVTDLRDSFDRFDLEATHALVSASVSLASAQPRSFAFVEFLDLVASSPALETLDLVQCEDCGLDGSSLQLAMERTDITPHVQSGALRVDLGVMGDVPEQPWLVDVELCFDTAGRYRKEW